MDKSTPQTTGTAAQSKPGAAGSQPAKPQTPATAETPRSQPPKPQPTATVQTPAVKPHTTAVKTPDADRSTAASDTQSDKHKVSRYVEFHLSTIGL